MLKTQLSDDSQVLQEFRGLLMVGQSFGTSWAVKYSGDSDIVTLAACDPISVMNKTV